LLEITSFGEEQISALWQTRGAQRHRSNKKSSYSNSESLHCRLFFFVSENGTEKSETTGNMKIFAVFILFVFGAVGENLVENYDRELSTIKLLFYPK
jgi:hypothetical protein